MSKEFLKDIPPELRAAWAENPEFVHSPMADKGTDLAIMQRVEEQKEHIRKTSILYKYFGENMFGFVTDGGALNFDWYFGNPSEMLTTLRKEAVFQKFSKAVIVGLPVGRAEFEYKVKPEVEGDEPTIAIGTVTYDVVETLGKINGNIDGIEESIKAVKEQFPEFKEGEIFYLGRDERDVVYGTNRMLATIARNTTGINNQQYFRKALKVPGTRLHVRVAVNAWNDR